MIAGVEARANEVDDAFRPCVSNNLHAAALDLRFKMMRTPPASVPASQPEVLAPELGWRAVRIRQLVRSYDLLQLHTSEVFGKQAILDGVATHQRLGEDSSFLQLVEGDAHLRDGRVESL